MKVTIVRGKDWERKEVELLNFERGKVHLQWLGAVPAPMLFWLRASGHGVLSPHSAGQGCAEFAQWWIVPDDVRKLCEMEERSKKAAKPNRSQGAPAK